MEDYYYMRRHVPAFGSWDWNTDMPFTQCFETATRAGAVRDQHQHYHQQQHGGGFLRYGYSDDDERDLYVTPAMIVVPARSRGTVGHNNSRVVKEEAEETKKKQKQSEWVVTNTNPPRYRATPKPVDEDLYKISPDLIFNAKLKKKRGMGFFSSCLMPSCVV